jgi:hypothetical protein
MRKPLLTDEDSRKFDYLTPPQTKCGGCEEEIRSARQEVDTHQTDFKQKQGKTFIGYMFIEPD